MRHRHEKWHQGVLISRSEYDDGFVDISALNQRLVTLEKQQTASATNAVPQSKKVGLWDRVKEALTNQSP